MVIALIHGVLQLLWCSMMYWDLIMCWHHHFGGQPTQYQLPACQRLLEHNQGTMSHMSPEVLVKVRPPHAAALHSMHSTEHPLYYSSP